MVRRGVPEPVSIPDHNNKKFPCPPVGQEGDLVSRHLDRSKRELPTISPNSRVPTLAQLGVGRLRSMSFRWYYPDQVRPVFLRTAACYGTLDLASPVPKVGRVGWARAATGMLPNTRLLHYLKLP